MNGLARSTSGQHGKGLCGDGPATGSAAVCAGVCEGVPGQESGAVRGSSADGGRSVALTLPWPPTVNTYYRNINGKTLISSDGRAYCKAVADQVLIQRGAKNYTGRLQVAIAAYPPDKRRRDLDNILKSLLDSLTRAGVWADDSQIDDLWIGRATMVGGMVKVAIVEIAKSDVLSALESA